MKNAVSRLAVIAVLLMMTLVLAGCADAIPTDTNAANAPDLTVGSWWEFRQDDGIQRLKLDRIDGDTLVLSDSDGRELNYSKSLNLKKVRLAEYEIITFEPDQGILSFPLSPGRSWSTRLRVTTENNGERTAIIFTSTNRAEQIEDVKTSAGRFRAYKVIAEGTTGAGAPTECWYAPIVKWVVKCRSGQRGVMIRDFELVGYHLEPVR